MLVFFTGITRHESSVLGEQKTNIDKTLGTLKDMAAMVPVFRDSLLNGDFQALGELLHDGWLRKKSLSSGVSNSAIDTIYAAGMRTGAWGGKVLGAGGGGCVLFIAPPDRKEDIRRAVWDAARDAQLPDFKDIPIRFVQSGADALYQTSDGMAAQANEKLHNELLA